MHATQLSVAPARQRGSGRMSLEDLANLGEAIGGFAVVRSLLFVGFELRRERDAYQRQGWRSQPLGLPRSFVEWVENDIVPPSTGEPPTA